MSQIKYLKLLAEKYPSIQDVATELISLQAVLNLPKGTEHFLSDLHGEYVPFLHMLKNASGVIKTKIDNLFCHTISEAERKTLATLIYYPELKLELIKRTQHNLEDWYKITLYRLVEVCKAVASKYTRSDVRKALPDNFEYIIDELLNASDQQVDKQQYYNEIINTILSIERADAFIISLSNLIQRLAINRLHILGDIFDRGPRADIILDTLMGYHNVDVQWGNHDIVWMGAAAANWACIANVLAMAAKYNNFDCLEEGYGISVRPLATFALDAYNDDECALFEPNNYEQLSIGEGDIKLCAKMHKAIVIIALKLEAQIILRNPHYMMGSRIMLDKIDYLNGKITLNGCTYELLDKHFPTISPANPLELSSEERELMERMESNFTHSEKLQKHVQFLFNKGGTYKICNKNLLYHGCIPMDANAEFSSFEYFGKHYSGKSLLDFANTITRKGYFSHRKDAEKRAAVDFFWYLWCGPLSPLFGKNQMATFERIFLSDPQLGEEIKNSYYEYANDEQVCIKILEEFGLDAKDSHIINGHVPVKITKGESPIKANGKLLVIDGGLSKAYQAITGIAGYTLIYNSHGLVLTSHAPFESVEKAIRDEVDIHSVSVTLEKSPYRQRVADTDEGVHIMEQIEDLQQLLEAYRLGIIK